MGAAGCKSSKLPTQNQQKDANKNITIGVFGLDNAGKTSTVKAIEGEPTERVQPTISSISSTVPNPLNDRIEKNRKQSGIKIIDVSGERKFRQKSWPQYYDQIHGLIFVIDASEKKRLSENQEILEDLLQHEKLKNKPVLILANKQDQRGAISTEHDLKRQLEIEKLKTKYKIELCTALPKNHKTKTDESIRKGFTWLIQTIDVNYSELNARVTKTKQTPWNTQTNRFESDDDSDNKYSKDKTPPYRAKITSEKLPSLNINKHQTKVYSDDDDRDYFPAKNDLNKNKTVPARITSHNRSIKKSDDNEPKAFRSTYEPFPEETPWSSSSVLKLSKNDETFPRLNTKSSVINETKRKGMSPLIHDTKSYSNGSLSKRNDDDDDDDDFNHQQKSKSTSRFDFSANKYPSINKKPTSSIYNDADDYTNYNNRRTITTPNKSYTHDDDDDDDDKNYLKKTPTTRSNKDYDDNKNYQRSNLTSGYRGTTSKPANHSTYDDDDDYYSNSKPITRSTYNNDHSTSKSTNRSKYNDDDDDDDDHGSSSKPATNSKYDNQGYSFSSSKFATRSNYDHGNRSLPSSKSKSHSKFEDDDDDDYPTSKTATRSKYHDDDDDDDDYQTSSKKANYGSGTSRSHVDDEDFFTTKDGSNTTSRFRKTTHYDS